MQKKRWKTMAAAAMALMLVLLLAGCGAASIPRPTPDEGISPITVTGSCEISMEDKAITVSGETDILDGALIYVSVVSQDGMVVDSAVVTKNGDTIPPQKFIITSEKYGPGVRQVTGFITCTPSRYGKQPDSVYNKYGKKFGNIEGFIWNDDGVVVQFASETISFNE